MDNDFLLDKIIGEQMIMLEHLAHENKRLRETAKVAERVCVKQLGELGRLREALELTLMLGKNTHDGRREAIHAQTRATLKGDE